MTPLPPNAPPSPSARRSLTGYVLAFLALALVPLLAHKLGDYVPGPGFRPLRRLPSDLGQWGQYGQWLCAVLVGLALVWAASSLHGLREPPFGFGSRKEAVKVQAELAIIGLEAAKINARAAFVSEALRYENLLIFHSVAIAARALAVPPHLIGHNFQGQATPDIKNNWQVLSKYVGDLRIGRPIAKALYSEELFNAYLQVYERFATAARTIGAEIFLEGYFKAFHDLLTEIRGAATRSG